jgi:hypothetical protein
MSSIALVLIHFFLLNFQHIPRRVITLVALTLVVFGCLLGIAVVHYLRQWDADTYQVLRFGRVIANFVGTTALVSIYYRWFGEQAAGVVLRHLFHCLVLHALVMVVMFYSPAFRDVIVNKIVQADPDSRTYHAKATGYRIAGLTDSWDALSGLQSLGLLMLPILLTRQPAISFSYAILATPLLLFSVAISGRTGFVTAASLMPITLVFADLRKLHRTTLVATAVALLGVSLLMGPLRQPALAALEESSLGRTVAMFGVKSTAAEQAQERIGDTLSGILQQHYFMPETWHVFWFGTGGSGRDTWDYVPADNGLVLNLHNLGFFSFTMIYGVVLAMLCSGLRVRRNHPAVAGATLLAVGLILMIDVKVMYVFSRNGFTVMMVPVLLSWWEAAANAKVLGTDPAHVQRMSPWMQS